MVESNNTRAMDQFIVAQNIERYRKLLNVTTDDAERQKIMMLLWEEEAKMASSARS